MALQLSLDLLLELTSESRSTSLSDCTTASSIDIRSDLAQRVQDYFASMQDLVWCCKVRLHFLSRSFHLWQVDPKLSLIDLIVSLLLLLLAFFTRYRLLEWWCLLDLLLQGLHLLAQLGRVHRP